MLDRLLSYLPWIPLWVDVTRPSQHRLGHGCCCGGRWSRGGCLLLAAGTLHYITMMKHVPLGRYGLHGIG